MEALNSRDLSTVYDAAAAWGLEGGHLRILRAKREFCAGMAESVTAWFGVARTAASIALALTQCCGFPLLFRDFPFDTLHSPGKESISWSTGVDYGLQEIS